MVNLVAKSPANGAFPITIGPLTLSEHLPEAITAVMPFAGRTDAVSADMGQAFPAPNCTSELGGTLAIWAGQNLALVLGAPPHSTHAALCDQSDAWAVFDLTGPGSDQALARLCPIDARPAQFAPGDTARTLLGHMNASITRLNAETLRIMVFRSMAQTALHDLTRAMKHAQRA